MSENEMGLSLSVQKHSNLHPDCENCFGLCCVALYFSDAEGFPINKNAGEPCPNLEQDFRCCIHNNLLEHGLKGCISFECFGAGQKVSKVSFGGRDWRKAPESAEKMFQAFHFMRQLHELLWYLTEALMLQSAGPIHGTLHSMLDETEQVTGLRPDLLMQLDLAAHRTKVNTLLLRTSELVRSEVLQGLKTQRGRKKTFGRGADLMGRDLRKIDLRGADLRGAYLIAADLRGADLNGTDFIGADFRDTDLSGADLSKSIFLTQAQLNVAKGDVSTKLPPLLTHPEYWSAST